MLYRRFYTFALPCLWLLCASCQPKNKAPTWGFAIQTAKDGMPQTTVRLVTEHQNYEFGKLLGTFDTSRTYLTRTDLPEGTIAVCKGHWVGANYWLCAARQKGKIVCYTGSSRSAG